MHNSIAGKMSFGFLYISMLYEILFFETNYFFEITLLLYALYGL